MGLTKQIDDLFDNIEKESRVKVLYACESGSRAWGLESKASDYDVRFIYVHPLNWYLNIEDQKKDTIESHTDRELVGGHLHSIDAAGWELRETLRLFRKSNASIFEWLDSPTIYRESGDAASLMRQLQTQFMDPKAMTWSYWSRANGDFKDYVSNDNRTSIKKYLYMVRSLLCCRWIEVMKSAPPTKFYTLVETLVNPTMFGLLDQRVYTDDMFTEPELEELTEHIDNAIVYKQNHIGYFVREHNEVFHKFITHELGRFEEVAVNMQRQRPDDEVVNRLNHLFRMVITEGLFNGSY